MIRITRSETPTEMPVSDLPIGAAFLLATMPRTVYIRGKVLTEGQVEVIYFVEGATRVVFSVVPKDTKVISLDDYDLTLSFTRPAPRRPRCVRPV